MKLMCWCIPIIPALEWLKQGCGFKATLGYSNILSPKCKVTLSLLKKKALTYRKVKMYRKGCLDSHQKVMTQVSICIENYKQIEKVDVAFLIVFKKIFNFMFICGYVCVGADACQGQKRA